MTNEQQAALERIQAAKRRVKAASDIYLAAPSGFLGGISRDCRKSLSVAIDEERDATQAALDAGCDLADVFGGEDLRGLTQSDVREELQGIGYA